MLNFVVGFIVGGCFGFLIFALVAAGCDDKQNDKRKAGWPVRGDADG